LPTAAEATLTDGVPAAASSVTTQMLRQGSSAYQVLVVVDPRYPWLAYSMREYGEPGPHSASDVLALESGVPTRTLTTSEFDTFKASVDESLEMVAASPDGKRLLDSYANIAPLPSLPTEDLAREHLFFDDDDLPSPVKLVVAKKTRGASEFVTFDLVRSTNGLGATGVIGYVPNRYHSVRGKDGNPMLMGPAEALAHEMVHGIHTLTGSQATGDTEHIQISFNPSRPEFLIERLRLPTEELLTHGGESLESVYAENPPFGGTSEDKKSSANFIEIKNGRQIDEYLRTAELSDEVKAQVKSIREARIVARRLSETSVVEGMTINGEPLPVRAHYADFSADRTDPRFTTPEGGFLGYEWGGRQSELSVANRTNYFNINVPGLTLKSDPPNTGKAFEPGQQAIFCAVSTTVGRCRAKPLKLSPRKRAAALEKYYQTHPSARHLTSRAAEPNNYYYYEVVPSATQEPLASEPVRPSPTTSTLPQSPGTVSPDVVSPQSAEITDSGRAPTGSTPGAGVKRVMLRELDVRRVEEHAHRLQEEILADKNFLKTLPKRTGVPMSATDIDTTHALVKAKIAALRPGAGMVAAGVGIGMGLYGAMQTYTDENATTIDKIEATASLIPVVGNGLGLERGVEDGDAQAIAVNSIALASILVAQAIPALGELVDTGLIVYCVAKATIVWWQSLDSREKRVVRNCVVEMLENIFDPFQVLVKVYETIKQWVTGTPQLLRCAPSDFLAHEHYKAPLRAEYENRRPKRSDTQQSYLRAGGFWSSPSSMFTQIAIRGDGSVTSGSSG